MIARAALAATMLVLMAGCAAQHEKYNWGDYDPSLYSYYKSPAKVGELTAALQAAIDEADSHNEPVAPGLRAEYGYLLLQQGKSAEAVTQFQAEEKRWPESKTFMDHMIQVASTRPSGAPTAGK